jgi:gamma-glutamylputrescine oxidase
MTLQETMAARSAPGISWYEATVGSTIPHYPALDGSASADVVIVGGGFTGSQAAYHLAEGRRPPSC